MDREELRDLLAHIKAARDMARHGLLEPDDLLRLVDEAEQIGADDVAEFLYALIDRVEGGAEELDKIIDYLKKHYYTSNE